MNKYISIKNKIEKLFFYTLGFFIFLLIRLISPILIIRTGPLLSGRIGHFAMNTELDQLKLLFNINKPNKSFINIYYIALPSCNIQLEKMWRRKLNTLPIKLLGPIDQINRKYFYDKKFDSVYNTSVVDNYNLLDKSKPLLSFDLGEIKIGERILCDMGLQPNDKFICLIIRDSEYLKKLNPSIDWSYHDYRDTNIENYYDACIELTSRGFYVIRMGSLVKDKFYIKNNKKLIDYANSKFRSDFMDIYLSSKCEFCLSSGTGLESVPEIFRKYMLFVNYLPFGYIQSFSDRYMFTTKKIKDISTGKLLSINEIISIGAHLFQKSEEYKENNLVLLENTSKEIKDAVIDLIEMKSLKPSLTVNQQKFWDLYPKNCMDIDGQNLHGETKSRISPSFINSNLYLLN
jgi:putative glycosyltransferase (TIGR04372 family)